MEISSKTSERGSDMKAFRHIGIQKALSFVGYSLLGKLLHWVIVPQIRSLILQLFGAKIGTNAIVQDVSFANLYHYGFTKLVIGKRCFIGDDVLIDCRGGVELEDDVTVSNRTNIITHINVGYDDHPAQKHYPTKEEKVILKKGVYIGTAVTILPGVIIGEASIVGAGAVVTKSVSPKTVVAGVPAKVIKKLP